MANLAVGRERARAELRLHTTECRPHSAVAIMRPSGLYSRPSVPIQAHRSATGIPIPVLPGRGVPRPELAALGKCERTAIGAETACNGVAQPVPCWTFSTESACVNVPNLSRIGGSQRSRPEIDRRPKRRDAGLRPLIDRDIPQPFAGQALVDVDALDIRNWERRRACRRR